MIAQLQERDERVLVWLTNPKDAERISAHFGRLGVLSTACDHARVCTELAQGAGAILLAEELLASPKASDLKQALADQPAWSDIPVVVLSRSEAAFQHLPPLANVLLVERPIRFRTLDSVIQVALRSRRRQYELRDQFEQREKIEEELREADRRKDEFLATLAHELRNPLAPIRNGLELIRLGHTNGAVLEQASNIMDRQLAQMVRLVDDLLDVSRITREKLDLHMDRVELSIVLRNAVETSRPLIEAHQHELIVSQSPEAVLLNADTTRLAQVFSNLLNNAAKYTKPGGRITLETQNQDGWVEVRVRDNGTGIPKEMLGRIFEMFAQVGRALERSQGGLGIGLTLAKRLVEKHGGTIEARSDGLGAGSEFIVRLPTAEANHVSKPATSGEQPAEFVGSRRVLVADDNVDSANSLGMMLQATGHEVRTAHDGAEAVRFAEEFRPDVAILDIGMPKMNGYDAAQRIRAEDWGKAIVLIALSGWGQEDDKRRSREAGFDTHLTKPVDFKTLRNLLIERQPLAL